MYKYQQLAAQIRPITEVDLILFKVSPEEKTHIVKQYNKALSNSKGDGTDVAQIFLKPLITEYPTWGEASLIYGLCLAYEGEYERAAGAVEYAINNVLSTENTLQIAQEALRLIREDMKKPRRSANVNSQDKDSMVAEFGNRTARSGMQAPILMRASSGQGKARMATDKERREVMMRAASSNGELADDDINVNIPMTPADKARLTTLIVGIVLLVALVILAVYFFVIPMIGKMKSADDNSARLEYLTRELGKNMDDETVSSIMAGYLEEFDIDIDADATAADGEGADEGTGEEATTADTSIDATSPTTSEEAGATSQTAEATTEGAIVPSVQGTDAASSEVGVESGAETGVETATETAAETAGEA